MTQTWVRRVIPTNNHHDWFRDGHMTQAGPIGMAPMKQCVGTMGKLGATWQPFHSTEKSCLRMKPTWSEENQETEIKSFFN